jgi:uncharacterized protein YegP (UPF0339 family)
MKNPKVQVYKDAAGKWRWRARARNGRIVADSAEGYSRRIDCMNGLASLASLVSEGKIENKEN